MLMAMAGVVGEVGGVREPGTRGLDVGNRQGPGLCLE